MINETSIYLKVWQWLTIRITAIFVIDSWYHKHAKKHTNVQEKGHEKDEC